LDPHHAAHVPENDEGVALSALFPA